MSKITVTELMQRWSKQAPKRAEKLSKCQISEMIKTTPNSLEARLAVNPYAAMLASPLRKCGFHSRIFPSSLLLRFGLAWHPETNRNWAYPTTDSKSENEGFGYYIQLKKGVVEAIQKGGK
ncbi:hypothetical protein A0J61_02839 [Choanephora cucurbitarum]|uniref:Uncharacterized protein n=1 Tax=Choanephora cucurbitarum TaxID=101091 RepID=A0A1C7NPE1_9FUNG|nr:hypothetical protein A0J61_02839 [Choanephora cucurbitarum]